MPGLDGYENRRHRPALVQPASARRKPCARIATVRREGAVDDITVTCPLHGSQFTIWTAAVLRGPAKTPLKTYRVFVDGDFGRVDVD